MPGPRQLFFGATRNVNGVRLGSFAKPFRGRGSPQLRIYSQQIPDCEAHSHSHTQPHKTKAFIKADGFFFNKK